MCVVLVANHLDEYKCHRERRMEIDIDASMRGEEKKNKNQFFVVARNRPVIFFYFIVINNDQFVLMIDYNLNSVEDEKDPLVKLHVSSPMYIYPE